MDKEKLEMMKQEAAWKNNYITYEAIKAYERNPDIDVLWNAIKVAEEMFRESQLNHKKAIQVANVPALPKHLYDNLHTTRAGEMTDGYHTLDELYHHRMVLFAALTKKYPARAWKSWKHADGTMYDDYFIVGMATPVGDFSYHYHKDNWDLFEVPAMDNAPAFDGHTSKDVGRLLEL